MYQVKEFETLYNLFESDQVTEAELLAEVEDLFAQPHANRPWLTKEWKDKREEILKESCEKCDSTINLTIQHTPGSKPKLTDYLHCKTKEEYLTFLQKVIDYRCMDVGTRTLCQKCAYHEDKKAGLIGRFNPKKIIDKYRQKGKDEPNIFDQ